MDVEKAAAAEKTAAAERTPIQMMSSLLRAHHPTSKDTFLHFVLSNLLIIHSILRKLTEYPADAISQSLAYEAAIRSKTFVPEENLQYGFHKLPIYRPNSKKIVHIPEEKLWLHKPALELKSISSISDKPCGKSVNPNPPPKVLTYKDIGYQPIKGKDVKFEVHTSFSEPEAPHKDSLPKDALGDCGFQLGDIIDVSTL